ncbi:MAG: hypothetical protein GTO33_09025, partial [Acidobacteria bacterium]|nr:hypothetical protein [Acidobacteriota bacterium]NIO59471.1 hypothetical protein [Acidobacteriota bacterium]NIT11178.1 hypothetical protein [Acidobacteriota bacterium]
VMNQAWKDILALNQSRPAVFNALTEGTIYLGVSNGFRGFSEGADYFTQLRD